MKVTGIVRRIDDLGRVVIPKELRKKLNIKEGDPLEYFIDENNNIVISKYRSIYKLTIYASLSKKGEGSIIINEIQDELNDILTRLKNEYRFTDSETANILHLFANDAYANYSIVLYGLEFYIAIA